MASGSGKSGSANLVLGIVHEISLPELSSPELSCGFRGSIEIPFQSFGGIASLVNGVSGGATSSRVGNGALTRGLESVRRMSISLHSALKLSSKTTTRHRALSPPKRRRATISHSSSVYCAILRAVASCLYSTDRAVQNLVYRACRDVFGFRAACAAGMTFAARARRLS